MGGSDATVKALRDLLTETKVFRKQVRRSNVALDIAIVCAEAALDGRARDQMPEAAGAAKGKPCQP